MGNASFAVLLAAYNGTPWLLEQVESILQQENVDVTVFISVDSSVDDTEILADDIASRDLRVRVLPHGETFGGAAKNFYRLIKDVDLSEFDFISFADQDDVWYRTKLFDAVELIRRTNSDAYSSDVLAFWDDGTEKLVVKSQKQTKFDYLFEAAGPGCTYVFKKSLIQDIKRCMLDSWGQLQNVSLHDWFCYAYARANEYKWVIDPKPSMLYRQHALNQVGVNHGFKAYKHRLNKVLDGWWLSQSLLIAHLVKVQDCDFVRQWADLKRYSLVKLAFKASKCRRNRRDQLFFFFLCLVLAVHGVNGDE